MYVDGFFESAGAEFVVEYDGAYWHATTFQKDINKTNILLNKDYYVIRVRENTTQHPLDLLPVESDNLLQLKFNYTADYRNLPALVDQIKTFVEQQ